MGCPTTTKGAIATPKIRASKNAPRRALVLVLLHALIALHIAYWMWKGSALSPLEPSEAMEFAKHGIVNAGLIFFGLTILSTLFLGRWFCGWACHVVALQDASLWLLTKLGIRPKPLRSRALALVPSFAALYMFAWPFVYRWWIGAEPHAVELALTKEDFWGTFPPWPVALATFAVAGGAIVYFLGAKGFCTYACPYGAIFGVADRFARGRIRVTDACEGCGHCTATCTSNVIVHEEVRRYGMVVDTGCMKCMDCVSVCPKGALYFGFGKPAFFARPARRSRKSFSWREELFLAGAFAATFFAFRGLYGVIPFLLALAIAGILAVAFCALARLALRSELTFCGLRLKSGGRLTRAGLVFVALMIAVLGGTAHSALIQKHSAASARIFAATSHLHEAHLVDPGFRLSGAERELVGRGLLEASFVERHGLLTTPQNAVHLAWFSLLDGDPDGFERHLRAALAGARETPSLELYLARFLHTRGRLDEALEHYLAGLDALSAAADFDRLALGLWGRGRHEEALDVWRRGVERNPENPDLVFNLGVALGSLGDLDAAADSFRRVLELDPGRVDARENLAGLPSAAGDGGR